MQKHSLRGSAAIVGTGLAGIGEAPGRTHLELLAEATAKALDDAGFRSLFRKSPVKRIGRDRFIRNVMIAIGNSGDATLAPAAQNALGDDSSLVRGAAAWALSRLLPRDQFATLASIHGANEADPDVRAEWSMAPAG